MREKGTMPEHSMYAYLSRCTTKELEGVLNYCVQGNRYKIYGEAVPVIMKILEERMKAEETDGKGHLNGADE